MKREVLRSFVNVYRDLVVRECDRTDARDLETMEAFGLMRSRVIVDEDDDAVVFGDTMEIGDTVYEWTASGRALIRHKERRRTPCGEHAPKEEAGG